MLDKRSHQIQRMFASVAHRYDFLNRLLSLSIDQLWRRFTRRKLDQRLGSGSVILDLCTGTGDLAIELSRIAAVIGCDFCHPMLVRGVEKSLRKNLANRIEFAEGDALQLPFASARFDAVTIAFGLRNLEHYETGIREMYRVLNDTGYLAILEFSIPKWPVYRQLYLFYFTKILPRIGALVSGKDGPYSYLPASVKEFPSVEALKEMLLSVGFNEVVAYPLTGGIATLHLASKRRMG